jgi:hypothetical protein
MCPDEAIDKLQPSSFFFLCLSRLINPAVGVGRLPALQFVEVSYMLLITQ